MVRPSFEQVPDRQLAEAVSEPFLRPTEFRFEYNLDQAQRYKGYPGFTDGYPYVPAYTVSIVAAYLRESQEGLRIQTNFA